MHMIDWNTYRAQIAAGVGGLAKLSPDTVKGYGQLGQGNARAGSLGAKMRELIALAVAISLRCDGCIASLAAEAKKLVRPKRKLRRPLVLPSA
jgi:alkylhydroperoxidase/carboxymuconolactone decarboxylase family protein YurZ